MDPLLIVIAQYFLAALLLLSGLHKVININRFQQAIIAYQLLPANLIKITVIILPFCELLASTLLVLSVQPWAALVAVLIFGVYFLAMLINLYRGYTNVDCGCSFSNKEAPLSQWHLLRNGLLIAMATLPLAPSSGRELIGFDIVQVSIAILCLGLLYLGFEALLANRIHLMDKGT